ncbi:stage 0 sporulation protein [Bacillus manliponensis]|uniref:Stage 0 sporulation protein n=1 Tax=Bacillus manliponensis TaxID=574376 RepID=A0A073K1H0_9BACI|nr:aspartyl-phosphate phosphatase Spo0E family protein [Bacillus manliponensis]KEK20376.1 stage 0 sporulation protein [Bacillus manliponensis]
MFIVRRKYEMEKLLKDIHVKRQEMIHLGIENGLNNLETIRVSQELDRLILQYQNYKEQNIIKLFFMKKRFYEKEYRNRKSSIFWRILVTGFMK